MGADERGVAWNQVGVHHYVSPPGRRLGLCVSAWGQLSPLLLVELLDAGSACLTTQLAELTVSDDGHHSHLLIHINPGPALDHDGCMTAPVCARCDADLLDALDAYGAGTLRPHLGPDASTDQLVLRALLTDAGYPLNDHVPYIPWALPDPQRVRVDVTRARAALTG